MWIQNADQNVWNLPQKADASAILEETGDFNGNGRQWPSLLRFLPVHMDAGQARETMPSSFENLIFNN